MPLNEKALQRRIKQHIYAKDHRFFAVVQPGFEKTALQELQGDAVKEPVLSEGGIEFTASIEELWKLHLCSRTVTRITMRISIFRALFWDKLKEKAAEEPWELYLNPTKALSFSITCRHSKLYHTGRIEEELRAAIKKRFRSQGHKGAITEGETQKIFVRFEDDVCTLSLDATGDPLYRRGYKTDVNEAPLRETLASAILSEAGIDNYDLLLDPMCGSGTIAIEGAAARLGIHPGMMRSFSFENWPDFPAARFAFIKKNLAAPAPMGFTAFASDIDGKSIEACRANAERAGVAGSMKIEQKDFFAAVRSDYPKGSLLIAMNPPYGERLGAGSGVADFYRRLGEKIRSSFNAAGFAVIVPGEEAEKAFALKWDRKILFMNGGIRVALIVRDGK